MTASATNTITVRSKILGKGKGNPIAATAAATNGETIVASTMLATITMVNLRVNDIF